MKSKILILVIFLCAITIPAVSAIDYTSEYPPVQSADYVKATSTSGVNYYPYYATDPTKSLIGTHVDNGWYTAATTNNRFHIDLGSAKVIKRIYFENYHESGSTYGRGAKNFTVWGSNSATAFAQLTYGTDTDWTQITADRLGFEAHVALNQADPQYAVLTNTNSYRYYAIKISTSQGDALAARRIVLQSESGDTTPPASITGLTNTTALCDQITWTWTNPGGSLNADYSYLYSLKNDVFIGNYSNSTSTATWTALTGETPYTISTKTVDLKDNMNATWVNATSTTTKCDLTPAQITNPNIPLCHTQNFFFWNGSSPDVNGYRVLNNYPELDSTRTASVSVSSATGAKTIGSWASPAVTTQTILAPGPWRFRSYFYVSSAVGTTRYEYIVYNRSSTGVETDLWYGNALTDDVNDLTATEHLLTYARRNSTTLFTGDRLVIKVNASTTSVTARTAYMTLAGNTQASMVQNGWWVCNESIAVSTPTPTPTAAPTWQPEINPPTDIKVDYIAMFYQWWWLPALIFIMIFLFGGRR